MDKFKNTEEAVKGNLYTNFTYNKASKNMRLSHHQLENMDKQELIRRFLSLQEHNIQLKNLLIKNQFNSNLLEVKNSNLEAVEKSDNEKDQNIPKKKKKKEFDFSKCEFEHVFIRLLYLGWNYQGYACVEDTTDTVEHHVINSLIKTCLIQSREKANYHRCGRTDKGVSAFTQVISVTVRKLSSSKDNDVCVMLNRVLPRDIRAWGYTRVQPDISARFNCTSRSYRYFFPRSNLDINAMNEGAQYLIGIHDFRNLCKMDVANGVVNFTREIKLAEILFLDDGDRCTDNSVKVSEEHNLGYNMCELRVVGSGFLWHQIRCIMSVLLMIGQHLEKPDIIKKLLDVSLCPRKPQYWLASDVGLCLFNAEYQDVIENKDWVTDNSQLAIVVSQLQSLWTESQIKSEMIRAMLKELEEILVSKNGTLPSSQINVIIGLRHLTTSANHKPLLLRNTCCSLEERVEHYSKRFKRDSVQSNYQNKLSEEQSVSINCQMETDTG